MLYYVIANYIYTLDIVYIIGGLSCGLVDPPGMILGYICITCGHPKNK